MRAAGSGDHGAWNALVERYTGLVWSVARTHRLDAAEAADVVQTTWLRLVEHLDRLRNPHAVGTWLATTARHEALRSLRRSGRVLPVGEEARLEPRLRDDAAVPDDLLRTERDAALWAAFDELPDRCRRLLRLLFADPPPTYEQIGAALDMPIGSIGPTRARCLGRLRALAEHTGVGSGDIDAEGGHGGR